MQLLDSTLLDKGVLEVIEADNPRSVKGCCKDMFEKWLSTQKNVSWNQLIEAIKNIGLLHLGNELEKDLKSENVMI